MNRVQQGQLIPAPCSVRWGDSFGMPQGFHWNGDFRWSVFVQYSLLTWLASWWKLSVPSTGALLQGSLSFLTQWCLDSKNKHPKRTWWKKLYCLLWPGFGGGGQINNVTSAVVTSWGRNTDPLLSGRSVRITGEKSMWDGKCWKMQSIMPVQGQGLIKSWLMSVEMHELNI